MSCPRLAAPAHEVEAAVYSRTRWVVIVLVLAWFALSASSAGAQCLEDALLSRAAAELLLAREERPSAELLTGAVRAAGSDAVGLHALFVPAREPAKTERQWLASLRGRVDGELTCGRADSEAGRLLIAVGRGAELAPIDERARLVRGQLRAGFHDAELVIADAHAQLVRVGVTPEDLQRGIALAPDLATPLKVQLVAHGPAGPRPVAERQLPALDATPTAPSAPRAAASSSTTLARSAVTEAGADAARLRSRAPADGRAQGSRPAAAERRGPTSSEATELRPTPAADPPPPNLQSPRAPAADSGVRIAGSPAARDAADSSALAAAEGGGARLAISSRGKPGAADSSALAAAHGGGGTSPRAAAAAAQSGKGLGALIMTLRAERGRGALRDNRLLREAATQHAQDVCAKGRVAHEVEAGDGPDARLARAGLSARVLGEAIARAEDTRAALHALENSPSHLYTLLDPRFTDVGVGVAKDSAQKLCFVVLLCAWPRYIGKN